MRPNGKRCAPFLFLACTVFSGTFATASTQQADTDKRVQDAARSVMQQHGIPGLAIAVTANGQQTFYNYGVASKETGQKVSRETLFEIGSISKTFTATLATYAQANDQLSLTDHPGKYLPQLQGSQLDKATLINLGTHTAGGFPLQVPDEVQNNQQLMDYFNAWQPQYAPGTHRTYANPSIGLLGMIAAKSMNLPFEEAMETGLFPKLGMSGSYLNVPASKMALYAQGYNKQDAPVRLNPGVLGAEAYGVKTSSQDLIRFVEANLNLAETDPRLKRAISDTHTGYFKVGPMTQDLIWEQYSYPVTLESLLEGNSDKMAYETQLATELIPALSAQQAVWINKTGSTNGFGAYVAFIPAKQLGIVILANKNYPNEARVRLAHQILSHLD
ncbi:class C beta-lactamase [Pseudomonas fluorescens]|uniref:Beta-lactamase n=1 Tax=Pseudomonas fluorescens TaxID=294 RepID=A0A5E7FD89_PSEFL|nr:class C beta-lactamase [Pseudomonas fluorescens]VVO35997.1 Beta-lactamase [Pseudomonas fluorescens]